MSASSEPLTGGWLLRFYAPGVDLSTMPPFRAVCVLEPHVSEPRTAWVRGLLGAFDRRAALDLGEAAQSLGLDTLLVVRAPGHIVPGGVMDKEGRLRIDVRATVNRLRKGQQGAEQ